MTAPRNDGLPELPRLPDSLLDRISRYGMARTECASEVDRLFRYEQLISGIKSYAAEYGEACRRASPSVGAISEKWLGDAAFYMASGENDKAVAYETCALELRAASPQPLLSREPEPISNASVTVGGVRVPGPIELNEANLLRYGADTWTGGTTTTNTMAGDVMTDNRGEVVAYADSAAERYVTLIRLTPAEDADIPLVPQSLLLAAREDHAKQSEYLCQKILEANIRAERAEAELAECRRNSERWKDYAMHQEWCAECAEDVGRCYDGQALRDAAIDACVGGET